MADFELKTKELDVVFVELALKPKFFFKFELKGKMHSIASFTSEELPLTNKHFNVSFLIDFVAVMFEKNVTNETTLSL